MTPMVMAGPASPAEQDFEELMEQAEAAAWRKSNSFTGKFATSAYFTARKAIRTSPLQALKFFAGHVPFAGPALSFGIGKIGTKIRGKRINAKLFKARMESTAEASKILAKSISELATKIDGTITKQKAACADLKTAGVALNSISANTSAQAWTQAFWNAAYAYYRVDHYNVTLADRIDKATEYLEKAAEYSEKCTTDLMTGERELRALFVEAHGQIVGVDFPLLGSRGRSSSSSSLSL